MIGRPAILIGLGFLMSISPLQSPISSDITFCNLQLREQLKQANLSFYLTYSFDIDQDGMPINLRKVSNEYVAEHEVLACIEEWRIRGLRKGQKVFATFYWRHGLGWVQLSVLGPQYEQIVRIRSGLH